MIEILITLLILAVIVYVAYLIIGMLHLPQPILNIVYIIAALIVLLILLDVTGLYSVRGGLR